MKRPPSPPPPPRCIRLVRCRRASLHPLCVHRTPAPFLAGSRRPFSRVSPSYFRRHTTPSFRHGCSSFTPSVKHLVAQDARFRHIFPSMPKSFSLMLVSLLLLGRMFFLSDTQSLQPMGTLHKHIFQIALQTALFMASCFRHMQRYNGTSGLHTLDALPLYHLFSIDPSPKISPFSMHSSTPNDDTTISVSSPSLLTAPSIDSFTLLIQQRTQTLPTIPKYRPPPTLHWAQLSLH